MASCFYQKNKDDMNLANVSEITDNIFIEHAADLVSFTALNRSLEYLF